MLTHDQPAASPIQKSMIDRWATGGFSGRPAYYKLSEDQENYGGSGAGGPGESGSPWKGCAGGQKPITSTRSITRNSSINFRANNNWKGGYRSILFYLLEAWLLLKGPRAPGGVFLSSPSWDGLGHPGHHEDIRLPGGSAWPSWLVLQWQTGRGWGRQSRWEVGPSLQP